MIKPENLSFEAHFDWNSIQKRESNLWRYQEALPIENFEKIISFHEGFTPLINLPFDKQKITTKLDFLFPTGSYKDRGATVLMSHVHQKGIQSVIQDSSGNAGCAIACYAAKANIPCTILVPEKTSQAKLTQIEAYGAKLLKIPGNREDTAKAALIMADTNYYASHVYNPYFLHGTKTFAYEVYEQTHGNIPNTWILPAGNGTLLLGVWLGLKDLAKAGYIDKLPRIIGIQAAACSPLWNLERNPEFDIGSYQSSETLAEGIAIAQPARAQDMIDVVKESGGFFMTVEEDEIIENFKFLANQGLYVEPTSAAIWAGATKYIQKAQDQSEKILTVLTGSGLKASEKINQLLQKSN